MNNKKNEIKEDILVLVDKYSKDLDDGEMNGIKLLILSILSTLVCAIDSNDSAEILSKISLTSLKYACPDELKEAFEEISKVAPIDDMQIEEKIRREEEKRQEKINIGKLINLPSPSTEIH